MSVQAGFLVPHPPLLVPEVGEGQEEDLAATAKQYDIIARRVAALLPETVVIISPHSTVYSDYIHISPGKGAKGNLKQLGAGHQFEVAYDQDLARALEDACAKNNVAAGGVGEHSPELDHGVMVPLYFFGQYCEDFRVLRISASGLPREDLYHFGMLLAKAAETIGRRIVVVASGDLSHRLAASSPYGYAPEGAVLDETLTGIIKTGDFYRLFEIDESLSEKGADCALGPMVILAGALDGKALRHGLLSYEGPFGVGYATGAFEILGEDENRLFHKKRMDAIKAEMRRLRRKEDAYVKLARLALETYVKTGKLPPLPERLPVELIRGRSGAFVTLKKRGQLRGCIGTDSATKDTLADEICHNSVEAGTQDPRFSPVEKWELSELVYSVDVLFPAVPATKDELDPAVYGVIVSSGRKQGLILPGQDGIDTAEEQLALARNKAGIPDGKPFAIERFEVARHR